MHSPIRSPIPVETLLLAYRSGIFPMADRRAEEDVFWVEPRDRAIIPLGGLHVSRSLRKTLRAQRFAITIDAAFGEVIRACAAPRADHPESWISDRIIASYEDLHAADHAHSIECWIEGEPGDDGYRERTLAGGLYGVTFDRVFCGESMFSHARDASKIALCWLVAMMREAGFAVLDCQFMTDHLASMGAVEISQKEYLEAVKEAEGTPGLDLPAAYDALLDEADRVHSSPGKLIAQSFTQTS